ncbi:MAG TPA: hypothetical protein VGO78_05970 [Acidimicrobiales bacterium]|jgi:hypothetical protein|nr:hypothetical protein [Acidimicrobiales bacterium]
MIASPGAVAGEPVTSIDRSIASGAGAGATVEVLRWPAEAARRAELAARARPRVLLVEPGELPPPLDPEEDWLRFPAPARDLRTRRARLARRYPR